MQEWKKKMKSETFEIVEVDEGDTVLCSSGCNYTTIAIGTHSVEGTMMDKYRCLNGSCDKEFLVHFKKKEPKYKCEDCGNDLTQGGSVLKYYYKTGQLDDDGYFDSTGDLHAEDTSSVCSDCCEPIG